MSVEARHLISIGRKGIDFCARKDYLEPGFTLRLGRLHPSKVIAACETDGIKEGTIIAFDPKKIVIELHQSWDDRVGTVIETEGLPVAIVSFSNEQWVVLYKRQKNVRRKIKLFHADDDSEIDDRKPYADDRLSL